MRILKKSLACLLVAIIAATAMFGCLVSADTINGTISVWGTTVHPDAESFDVYVDVAAESAISVARVKVNVPAALGTITSATVEGEGVKAFDTEVPDEDYDLANGIFLVEGSDWSVGYTYATITLTITPAADVAAGTYAVTAENITDVEGADWSENPCTFAITNADVIVPYALTLDGDNLAVTLAAGETATVMGTVGGAVGVVEATGAYSIGYGFMPVNGDFIMTMFGGGNTFTVTNNADAEITVTLKHYTLPTKGTMDDPEIITENGNYVANVGLNHVDQGYYYQYTATEAGTVNIEMNSDTWFYNVNNLTTYAYGDNVYSDDGSATYSVDVAAGDIIQIIVNTNTYAVGTVDWDFAFEAAVTEPEVDPNLQFVGASVGFGTSSLQVNFIVRNTVLALYDDMEVVIMPQKYDGDLNLNTDIEPIVIPKASLAAAGSNFKSYIFTNIELHEIGLDIDYMLRAYDAEDNLVAVSEKFTTSAASFLKSLYASQTDKPLFRTLITDTLLVGYEAIDRMAASYPDSDLATDLTENGSIIDDFDISEATQTIDSYNTVNEFNSYNSAYTEASSATHRLLKSVAIGKVPYITYRIKDTSGALDLDKLSFKVSYTGFTGEFDQTYTTANGDISLINGWVNFKFYDISLADGNKDIFVEAYYDGEKVFDTTYSVETFLGSQMTNANIGELAKACIKLGISFRAYSE